MSEFLWWCLGMMILILHSFLSRQRQPLLGGIIPLGYGVFIAMVFYKYTAEITHDIILPFSAGFIILLIFWVHGRESFKKKTIVKQV